MKKKNEKAVQFLGAIGITFIGFLTIPPLIKKVSQKLYRDDIEKKEFNFDDFEPEIVEKQKKATEETELNEKEED